MNLSKRVKKINTKKLHIININLVDLGCLFLFEIGKKRRIGC